MCRLIYAALHRRKKKAGPALAQNQSALFRFLPAEIRLMIREAVLCDPTRLLHIISYRGSEKRKHIGHCHCIDQESPYPLSQHKCFGVWATEAGAHYRRREPRSNSNLLVWLLSCRMVYFEAIDVLYNSNTFSFKGASGFSSFRSLTPTHNWSRIRLLNIATVFRILRPFAYEDWEMACTAISTLSSLRYLAVGMTMWNRYDHKAVDPVEPEALLRIFGPLLALEAGSIEVDINIEVPEAVKDMLGRVNFKLERCHRRYDGRICLQF